MGKSDTGQLVLIGAIGLAAVYLLTRRQTAAPPQSPTQPATTTTQQQQQQLMNWAQTQSSATTISKIISGLDWQGISDMWSKIFGSSSSSPSYSGGGTDDIVNPYESYDPYNYSNNSEYLV